MGSTGEKPAPVISVVIPSRNEERYLPAALESVAEQDYPIGRIECIVVENGSVDGTYDADVAARPARWVWLVLRDAMADLRVMAGRDFEPNDFVALHGVTLLGSTARRLGFEARPLPPSWYRGLMRFFMMGLLSIYNPAGSSRLASVDQTRYPAEFWFSRKSLLERYGGHDDRTYTVRERRN